MPRGLQLRAQRLEVVDLAIEDQPDRPVLVRHRLAASLRQVDDAEPAMAKTHERQDLRASVVWSSPGHRVTHAIESVGLNSSGEVDNAADAAHGGSLGAA